MESGAAFQDGRGLSVSPRGGKEAGETGGRYRRAKGCFAEQRLRLPEERASLPGSRKRRRKGRVRESARGQAEESRSMASNFSAKMSVSEGKLETGRWGRCEIE